jgi:hypothetical protein
MKRRSRRRILVALLLLIVVAINAIAFLQAWSMTHFVGVGLHTDAPEKLSFVRKVWVVLTGVHIPRLTNLQNPSDFGLDYQTGHVRSTGADLEVWSIPAADRTRGLVLMYHAYASSKSSLLPAAREFHLMGYALEMVDFPGSGGSGGNSTTIGFREADATRRGTARFYHRMRIGGARPWSGCWANS